MVWTKRQDANSYSSNGGINYGKKVNLVTIIILEIAETIIK